MAFWGMDFLIPVSTKVEFPECGHETVFFFEWHSCIFKCQFSNNEMLFYGCPNFIFVIVIIWLFNFWYWIHSDFLPLPLFLWILRKFPPAQLLQKMCDPLIPLFLCNSNCMLKYASMARIYCFHSFIKRYKCNICTFKTEMLYFYC